MNAATNCLNGTGIGWSSDGGVPEGSSYVHSPRGRRRGGRRSAERVSRVHHTHDHALPRLAARRHAADEVEEPRAVEPELGVGPAAREPAHRARRAAAAVVAAAHQEDRIVLRVLEI
jgi:hypothetical protein